MSQDSKPLSDRLALVALHDRETLTAVVSVARGSGLSVMTFESMQLLQRQLQEHACIDLIITELQSSQSRGFEVLRSICQSRRFRRYPVILCGDHAGPELVQTIAGLGVAGFLLRPVQSEKLIAKINQVLDSDPGEILVVDEEPLILNHLSRTLQWAGYRVCTETTGAGAIERLKSQNIALAVVEIEMEGMTGIELLEETKKLETPVPVILLTSNSSRYGETSAREAGAAALLTKPLNNRALVQTVHSVYEGLRIHRRRTALAQAT